MSLGHSHNSPHRVDLPGRKALAVVLALFLAAGAFVLASGEARADETKPAAVQQSTLVIGEGATPRATPVVSETPSPPVGGMPAVETPLPEAPTADPLPEPGPAPRQPEPQGPVVVTPNRGNAQVGDAKSPPKESPSKKKEAPSKGAPTSEEPSKPPADPAPSWPKPDPTPGPVAPEPTTTEPDPLPQWFAVVLVNGERVQSDPAPPWPATDTDPVPDTGPVGTDPVGTDPVGTDPVPDTDPITDTGPVGTDPVGTDPITDIEPSAGTDLVSDSAASEPAPVPAPAWGAWTTPQPWPSDQYDPGSAASEPQGFVPAVEPAAVEPMAPEPLGSLPASLGKPAAFDEELSPLWPASAQPALLPGNAPNIGATTIEVAPAAGQKQPQVVGPIFSNVPAIVAPTPTAPLPPPVAGRKPPVPVSSIPTPPRPAASSAGTKMSEALSSVADAFRSAAASATSAAEQALGALTGGSAEPQEDPSQGTPQPVAPLAPPLGGSFFSLFGGGGGGQAGIGAAGMGPLLLAGILASVLVLLRKDGRFTLISHELLEPSSALLPPLERPG